MGSGASTDYSPTTFAPGANLRIEASGPEGEFVLRNADVPQCPDKGLIIKTSFAGLCHTDLHIWENKFKLSDDLVLPVEAMSPNFKWPAILGHEISGEVVALGKEEVTGASKVKVGDRVVVFPWIGCSECGWCKAGMNNFCPNSQDHDIGVVNHGGFQSFVAIPNKRYVVPTHSSIPDDEACLFGCSAITAYNACRKALPALSRAVKATGEAKFLVSGAGGLGFWCIGIAKAMFPPTTKIIVASSGADKLKEAKALGAHETIEWPRDGDENDLIEKTKAATKGIDAAVDTVSIATTLNRILQCTNKGATIVAPGMSGGVFPLPLLMLTMREVALTGTYTGTAAHIAEFMQFYVKHKLKAPPIQHIKPEEVDGAMRKLREGKILGRAVIKF